MLPPVDRRRLRQRKACTQCTHSKRKCDKTAPACKRCIERSDTCEYAPIPQRPHPADDNNHLTPPSPFPLNTQSWLPLSPPSLPSTYNPFLLPFLSPPQLPTPLPPTTAWFLHPSTFTLQHGLPPPPPFLPTDVGTAALPHFISTLQSWLRTWSTTLHSPLFHRHAFTPTLSTTSSALPAAVQDALTSLMAYHAATPAMKSTVLEIVTDRAERLIADSAVVGVVPLDVRGHLARTVALLVYQVIGLFDGDVRARGMAEERGDVWCAWAGEMLETVREEASAGGGFVVAEAEWRAWVVVESVRRVFLVGSYVQSVYTTMRRGWSVCPGGLAFTAGEGLWEEMAGWRWRRRVGELEGKGVLLVGSLEAYRVMVERECGEVDEFTRAVLEISYGLEAVERWMKEGKATFG